MSDPWATVVPSIIVSFATTVITLAGAGAIAVAQKARTSRSEPLAAYRVSGSYWQLYNETRRPIIDLKLNVSHEGSVRPIENFSATLYPKPDSRHLGALQEGDEVIARWTVPGRKKARATRSARVLIRGDEVRQPLRLDPEMITGASM